MRNHRLVNQIKVAQCQTGRWVTGNHNNKSSVSDLVQSLGWCSLKQHRVDTRLNLLCKIIHRLVSTQLKDHLKYPVRNVKPTQLQMNTDYSMFSFLSYTMERFTIKCDWQSNS